MENQFDNTLVSEMNGGSKRPQFLKVLCILSFVWCGLAFIGAIYGLIANTPERMAEKVEQVREFSPSMAQEMEQQLEAQQNSTMAKIQPYISIVLLLVSFFGVLQMFNLKKMGFYIYTAAELIPYIFLIVGGKEAMNMMGSMGGGAMKAAAVVMMVLMVLFDITFIVMYAMNLKHMKK
jgi:hypothetical protein